MGELWSRLTIKQKKLISWLTVALIIGVGLLMLQPSRPAEVPSTISSSTLVQTKTSISTQEELETRLQAILNALLGGKNTEVFLIMEGGPKLNIAYDRTEVERYGSEGLSERQWTSNPVLMRNDAERKEVPLVLEQIEPTVRGVLVVVSHEPRAELRLAISQAVATALHVPMYRIEVLFKQ